MTPFEDHRLYVGGLAPPKRKRGGRSVAWVGAVVGILCLAVIALGVVHQRSERCLQLRAQAQMVNSSAWIDECAR